MTLFPNTPYAAAGDYCSAYLRQLADAANGIDRESVERAAAVLAGAIKAGASVFVCGNGGSAAIADHLTCDFLKGIRTHTHLRPRVTSLVGAVALMTAIGNDIGYAEIFRYQLESLAKPGDVLMAVSSSGDSENIVRALEWARGNLVSTIALTGFSGGRAAALADIHVHVPAENYGVVEDLHQSLMHILAQFIRQAHLDEGRLGTTKF